MTEPHELKRLMLQMAELLEHFRHHGESIRDASLASAGRLEHAAGTVSGVMQQAARDALAPVAHEVARQIDAQQQTVRRLQVTARWVALLSAVLALTMAGLLAAFASQARRHLAEAERYALDAQWGRMLAEADLIPCDGRVCVNVEEAARRYGEREQYQPAELRQTPPQR